MRWWIGDSGASKQTGAKPSPTLLLHQLSQSNIPTHMLHPFGRREQRKEELVRVKKGKKRFAIHLQPGLEPGRGNEPLAAVGVNVC